MTTVIKNGTVVTADLTYEADVLIDGGKIIEIGQGLSGDETLDATGCYVMPGGIDPHTHLEMPFMGTYSSDDFESGTRAALSGGTTMVVDFALPSPGQGLLDAIQMWDNKSTRANCDYSFHMAVTWWGEQVFNEMETVVKERGINTFKHFMAYKGALMVNDDEMFAAFQRCGELGAIPLVHAENGDIVADLQQKLLAEGNNGPEAHAYSRPPEVEGEATNRAIMIADMAGVPLYVVHVSSEDAHEAIRRARSLGKRVWGEPLIQHLTLDDSEYRHPDWDHAARRVMSPPFRDKKHQDNLWAGLQSGSLSVVATDHCAFTTEQKRNGIGDFTQIPNGTGGLEDRMPMLWTHGVATGRLTMNEFVAVTSTNIAKILNMYPRKGAVLVGADADLVVWDPAKEKTITAGAQQSAIDYNVFEGKQVKGLPRFTLTRGKVAIHDGEVRTEEGHGEFVKRPPGQSVTKALSTWKELTAPRKVERAGIPASGSDCVSDLTEDEVQALNTAASAAIAYRGSVTDRKLRPQDDLETAVARFRTPLADAGSPAADVIARMAADAQPGLNQMTSPNFYGYVLGGSHPAGVAADMLVSAWGQNAGSAFETPAITGMERAVCDWVIDLLGLPPDSGAGLVTGATVANTVGVMSARNALLSRQGWEVERKGLFGAPDVPVLIGEDTHSAPLAALRYAGFGDERLMRVATDANGCVLSDALADALEACSSPPLVILQAGQINTGAMDRFAELVPMVRERGGWVHVDGAFGLWLAAVPDLRHRIAGVELADSWAVDLHKWLNAPFDAGMIIVRERAPLVASMSARGAYLPAKTDHWEPADSTPELSRRARGVPSYAILRHLGRDGVREMIRRHCALAQRLSERIEAEPGLEVLNDVVGNQVALACATDELTNRVLHRVHARNVVYPTHGEWRGRAIIRASIIGYAMQAEHIDRLADELIAAHRIEVQSG